jgi:hypothetical protein
LWAAEACSARFSTEPFAEPSLVSEEQATMIRAAPARIDAGVRGESDRFMGFLLEMTPAP